MTLDPDASLPASLAVRVGHQSQTLHPGAGVAVIGRDSGAAIQLDNPQISRTHLRLEPHRDGWQAIDTSTNGVFVDGVRRNSVLITGPITVCLGAADGIPVTLTPQAPYRPSPEESTRVLSEPDTDEDEWWDIDIDDPGVLHAGRAVADRRQELELTQRSLARDKVINAGTLIAFEKGRSWPRRQTQAKLERALGWSPGSIMRLRNEVRRPPSGVQAVPGIAAAAGHDEATEVFTDTVRAPLMAETVELAMHTLASAIAELTDPSDTGFTPKATAILADLRKLEKLAASAARNAKGTPSVVLALSSVRRTYNELMLRAARSPQATLGQRLYEARHRAELSLEEAANGAGLPTAVLEDAEAERTIAAADATALENLIAQLAMG